MSSVGYNFSLLQNENLAWASHLYSLAVQFCLLSSVGHKFWYVFSLIPESFGYIYITTIKFFSSEFLLGQIRFRPCRKVFCRAMRYGTMKYEQCFLIYLDLIAHLSSDKKYLISQGWSLFFRMNITKTARKVS